MRSARLRWLAVLAALMLVLAACGDSGEESSSDPFGGGGESSSDEDPFGGSSDDLPSADDLEDFADLTDIPDVLGLSDECEALAEVFLGMSQIFLGNTGSADELFANAAGALPGALEDDIETIRDAVGAYGEALEDAGVDFNDPNAFASLTPAQQGALADASEVLDTDAVNDAFDNLDAYGQAECDTFAP
jgi:hypothetical protein